jgi:hypothetical protein
MGRDHLRGGATGPSTCRHGHALVERAPEDFVCDGVQVVEVKTLDASAGYEPYIATRSFWEARGFVRSSASTNFRAGSLATRRAFTWRSRLAMRNRGCGRLPCTRVGAGPPAEPYQRWTLSSWFDLERPGDDVPARQPSSARAKPAGRCSARPHIAGSVRGRGSLADIVMAHGTARATSAPPSLYSPRVQ